MQRFLLCSNLTERKGALPNLINCCSLPEEAESSYVTLVISNPTSSDNLLDSSSSSGKQGAGGGRSDGEDGTTAGVECARSPKAYSWFSKVNFCSKFV